VFTVVAGVSHAAAAAPACIPPVEVSNAKSVRVEKNGVIVLADGRAARLEGVLLPTGASDHAPQFLGGQAISTLADLTADHTVDLAVAPPKEDRYGRIRAQILLHAKGGDIWLQEEMLRKGLARVAIAPDRNECVEELYTAEARARRDKAGLWASSDYAIRTPSQTEGDVGTFQIVEGVVDSVSSNGGRVFLDFAQGERTGFVATISPDDMKRFREIGVEPFAYANETVRVRGWIERVSSRPEIALATPAQVEVVEATQSRGPPPPRVTHK
jgi:micrococcal nuclease